MKHLFTIFFLHLFVISAAQIKLKGAYCTSKSWVNRCVVFKNDSLFDYYYLDCLNDIEAQGTYKINKKKLVLTFGDPRKPKSSFTVKDTNCNQTDNIEFNFFAIDANSKESIPGVTIRLNNDQEIGATGINGIAVLNVQKGDKEFNVDVSCVGCSGFTFKLKSDNCKKILVNLAVSGSFIEDGTQQEYKIKRRGINKKVLKECKYKTRLTKMKTNRKTVIS